jgi:predicted DNA-binding transcriptional regulator YafY
LRKGSFLDLCEDRSVLATSERLLRLLSLLQSRRDWPGPELAERLAVTTRTVRNDVERLRALGYRVDSATGPTGGYRLGVGAALPPLLLDDEEAVAVTVGLRAAAAGTVTGIEETSLRALAKLERTLPNRLRQRVDALRAATVSATGRGPTVDAATLSAVAAAARDHERLRFDYLDHDGRATVREVEPHRLVYTGRRWYLVGWDTDRRDWRTFRADRVRPRTPTGPRFVPREPPGGDVVAHVLRGAGSRAWRHPARVRLHAPTEAMADRIPPAAGLLEPLDPDTCLLETGGESLANLAGFLISLDVPFTVLDPPELRDHLATVAARLPRPPRLARPARVVAVDRPVS